ncbi:sodium-dependent transporter [candidate division KSB1 bacterium]
MQKNELFTSRTGLILAALGMALGTGNIWRFPRIIGENGGGSFLIPWIIFLFLWSIPLLILEFSLGKGARKGTIGAFGKIMGKKFGWMGAYVGFCAMGIMFYYSVVTGWCFKYLTSAFSGNVMQQDGLTYWNTFINSAYQPIVFHFLAMLIGSFIIYRGVVQGIEKANKLLIPSLFILMIMALIRSLTLPGAMEGVNYLFTPNLSELLNYKVWLAALTQSAWSTGAGWGLILTYGVYMKQKEDIVLNSGIIGLGDYSISLIAALAIVPVVFAISPSVESLQSVTQAGPEQIAIFEQMTDIERSESFVQVSGPASTGLTFIAIPQLFSKMPGGQFFLVLFFLALSFAAVSSLISMIELTTRIFIDMGMVRKKAIIFVGAIGFVLGAPSALSMGFFSNQDWVWGIGLMVSGFFIALAAIKYGVKKFREDFINLEGNDINLGRGFDFIVYLIPVQFIILIWWWFSQAGGWTDIFSSFSVGTCLFQWGIAVIIFIIFNKWLMNKTLKDEQ